MNHKVSGSCIDENGSKKTPVKSIKMKFLWPGLLFISDLFFTFLVWITNQRAFNSVTVIIVLFTVIIILAGYFWDKRSTHLQVEALEQFLIHQDEKSETELLSVTDSSWHVSIHSLSQLLNEQSASINDAQINLMNYQEFIEEWTHEIKTPLSLSALVLENHKGEMSPYVYKRMQHVQHTIRSDVDRILYYARLQADHVDYRFEMVNLYDCARECLTDFQEIAEEKNILVQLNLPPLQVVSDKKVLSFMLSQMLGNAFKYTSSTNGIVRISGWADEDNESNEAIKDNEDNKDGKDSKHNDNDDDIKNRMTHLTIWNNGKGVPPEDLPFLFDKGFTGNHPDRQNATGMGLYLVKKYAELLSVDVSVEPGSACGNGFGIRMDFPKVNTLLHTQTNSCNS